jgi:hypothetical protein
MATDERARHALFCKLEEVLGLEAATTLMELLPRPEFRTLDSRLDQLERRLDNIERGLDLNSVIA